MRRKLKFLSLFYHATAHGPCLGTHGRARSLAQQKATMSNRLHGPCACRQDRARPNLPQNRSQLLLPH